MAAGPVWPDRIVHKTVLKLAEEGVEAAAATATMATGAMARPDPPQPFHMVVDRPFIFMLRHRATGTIVLLGVIDNPRQLGS